MEEIDVDNQIVLLLAVKKFYKLSENKELVMPLIFKWFNEHSTQFVPANQLTAIVKSIFEVPQEKIVPRPLSFRSL